MFTNTFVINFSQNLLKKKHEFNFENFIKDLITRNLKPTKLHQHENNCHILIK